MKVLGAPLVLESSPPRDIHLGGEGKQQGSRGTPAGAKHGASTLLHEESAAPQKAEADKRVTAAHENKLSQRAHSSMHAGPHDTGGRVGVKKEQQIDSTLGAAASAAAEAAAKAAVEGKSQSALAEGKSEQQPGIQQQLDRVQSNQQRGAQRLKYSSDKDRVRWNQTPTHAPTQGEVSKIGEAALPTPKPQHIVSSLPSFPSIPEHGGLTVKSNLANPEDVQKPLVSPALSTMTTGSSGWHDWEDNFDYSAVGAMTSANTAANTSSKGSSLHAESVDGRPNRHTISRSGTPKSTKLNSGGSDLDLLENRRNSTLTKNNLEQLDATSTASAAMAAARSGNPNIINTMQMIAPELSSPINNMMLKQHQQQHELFQKFQQFQQMQHQLQQQEQSGKQSLSADSEVFKTAHRAVSPHVKTKKATIRLQAQNVQIRCVVYKAGDRFGEPVGQGQLMTVPKQSSKYSSPAEAKRLFDEFLFDAAVRLGLAKKMDPLVAPPSPSRRRRVSILRAEIQRLEEDETKGRYVDPTFLHGLKNKLEVLRLGDDATRRNDHTDEITAVLDEHMGSTMKNQSARLGIEGRRKRADDHEFQSPRPEDIARLSLWHSKFRAQIRDFSSIRDGDALLLRSMGPEEGKQGGRATLVAQLPDVNGNRGAVMHEHKDDNAVEGGDSAIFEQSSSGSLLGMEPQTIKKGRKISSHDNLERNRRTQKSPQRRITSPGSDKNNASSMPEESYEDILRLRRIGLSQLLNAIRSKRTLFGKRLKGARQAFAAMDRDGDGLISAEDLKSAMHRLDIKLSDAATRELIALMDRGAFKSPSRNGRDADANAAPNKLRIADFIDLLQTVADDPNDTDSRDWLGEGASITLSGLNTSSSMRSSILVSGGRSQKRKRRRRRMSYRDPTPDTRPDEELMWDIESNVNDPLPLQAFAERLIVRGQGGRAVQYMRRALQMAEQQDKENRERLTEHVASRNGNRSGRMVNTFGVEEEGSQTTDVGGSIVMEDPNAIHLKYEPEDSFALLTHKAQVRNLSLRLELMQRLGTLYAHEEHFGAAQQIFEEAIELAPLSAGGDEDLGELSTASTSISVVLDSGVITSTKASPLGLLASLLERIREYDKAEEAHLRALAIDPEHTHSLLGLANLLADVRGDSKGAEAYYFRAVSCASKDFNDADMPLKGARRNMLESLRCFAVFKHRIQGDYAGALSLLRQAVAVPAPSIAPNVQHRHTKKNKRPIHPDKASVLVEMGKIELARLSDDPTMSGRQNNMGTATDGGIDKRKGGSVLGAVVELFESALEVCPDHLSAKLELAMLLSQRSRAPKDRITATELFEGVISVDPEHSQALLPLAQHLDYTSQGAPRYVEDLYTRAITAVDAMYRAAPRPDLPLSLKSWEPRLAFATFLEFRRLDPKRAGVEYENAVKSAPHEPTVLCALAIFKANPPAISGSNAIDVDGAEALFRAALDSDPLHCESLVGLADLLWNARGEHDAAEALLKRAVGVVETLVQKRKANHVGGTRGDASPAKRKSEYRRKATVKNPPIGGPSGRAGASRSDPGFLAGSVYRQYAMLLVSKGRHKEASKQFLKAIKSDPSHAPTRTAYALVLAYHMRDYELAEQQLLRSLELSPDSPEALHHLGRLYEEHVIALRGVTSDGGAKARARAMQCYKNCLEIEPDHVATLVRMGTLLADKANGTGRKHSSGRWSKGGHNPNDRKLALQRANEAFARAVAAAGAEDADAYYAYASFLMKNQSNDRDSCLMAKRFFMRAIEIDPCHVLALDELAAIHESEANFEEAEKLWVEALDVEPTMAPSQADFVSLLERVRTRCYNAEAAVDRDEDGGAFAAKSLVLHQQLRKYATLKAMYASRMDTTGDDMLPPATVSTLKPQQGNELESDGGVYLRHSRAYLKAFRDQFKDNSRNAYRS